MVSTFKDIAVLLAREAGELIVAGREGTVEVADTKSSSVDIVTVVDSASEEHIFRRLEELRPGDGFLGEEGRTRDSTTGITWVVDPIDGTVNFLYNLPHYAVSIAAVSGNPTPGSWQVEAGVVFNPVTGEMFSAARGEGSFLGGQRLQISDPPPVAQALLATGFAYSSAVRKEQARVMMGLLPEFRDIRRQGTASLDMAYVALGSCRRGTYRHRGRRRHRGTGRNATRSRRSFCGASGPGGPASGQGEGTGGGHAVGGSSRVGFGRIAGVR
jgi:myo-inositol-1(or 4)-monophosphatase